MAALDDARPSSVLAQALQEAQETPQVGKNGPARPKTRQDAAKTTPTPIFGAGVRT
jgi:hypothetical protein